MNRRNVLAMLGSLPFVGTLFASPVKHLVGGKPYFIKEGETTQDILDCRKEELWQQIEDLVRRTAEPVFIFHLPPHSPEARLDIEQSFREMDINALVMPSHYESIEVQCIQPDQLGLLREMIDRCFDEIRKNHSWPV